MGPPEILYLRRDGKDFAYQVDDARCSGTLEILDSMSSVVVTYAFDRGWPSKYTPICMIAGEDQAPAEEITIVVENFRREGLPDVVIEAAR